MTIFFFAAVFFIFGSIIGSFLNVVILRLPKNKSLFGRSFCPTCKHILGWKELVPLVSFLLLQGKCAYCSKPISPRYFIIEAVTGLLFAVSAVHFFPITGVISALVLIRVLLVSAGLVVICVIDYEHFLILDSVLLWTGVLLLGIGILQGVITGSLTDLAVSIVAGVAAASFFYTIWFFSQGAWIGFGDVKLALWLGLALGFPYVFIAILLACVIGALISAPLLVMKKKHIKSPVPFGSFLSLAAFIVVLYGPALWQGYLSLLGW